jgi:hypothetical protein
LDLEIDGENQRNIPEVEQADDEMTRIQNEVEQIFRAMPDPKHRQDELRMMLGRYGKRTDAIGIQIRGWIREQIDLQAVPDTKIIEEATSALQYAESVANFGSNVKEQRKALQRWLDKYGTRSGVPSELVDRARELLHVEDKFTPEEEAKLVQYCLDVVFDRGDKTNSTFYNRDSLIRSILGMNGWLDRELGKNFQEIELLKEKAIEIVDNLGVENWMAVRENVSNWNNLANTADVTSGVLREGLFLPDSVEKFFAQDLDKPDSKRMIRIPTETASGRILTVEVDGQEEISKAMKRMYEYFSGKWIPDPANPRNNGIVGDHGKKEYWSLLGIDNVSRLKLFEEIGVNKYIGEAAFSIMLSHNILTETSSNDIFLMMVNSAKKRPGNYGVNEARDAFVRMKVQEELAAGRGMPSKETLESWVAQNMPRHFIPTGLSDGGKEKLVSGNWLKWRVEENMLSRKKTTPDARLTMMRDALDVLTALKDAVKPEATVKNLEDIMGKILKWARADLDAVGWTSPDPAGGSGKIVDKEFCMENSSGTSAPMESFDWAGRMMLTLAKTFIYTHSVLDAENQKPSDLNNLAELAGDLLSLKFQSGKGAIIGLSLDPRKKSEEKREFVNFVDKIFDNCAAVAESVVPFSGAKIPDWFDRRRFSTDFRKMLSGQYAKRGAWNRVKSQIKHL